MEQSTKIQKMLKIAQMLYDGEDLYSSNKTQQTILDLDARTYNRYLNEAEAILANYIYVNKTDQTINGKNVKVYKKTKINEDLGSFLKFFFENYDDDLVYFFPLINEKNPDILKKYDKEDREDIEKMIKKDEGIFLFRTNPYENISDTGKFFSLLKHAVKEREYLDIQYKYTDTIHYKSIKPLKLIFSEDNWYVAIEYNSGLILLRVSFIQNVQKSQNKNHFQPNVPKKYSDYFTTMQNSMSLQNSDKETAVLRASKKVSIYFKKDMKPFFISQRFIGEDDEGCITFEVTYTQPLEILPFVKKWLPDIEVISPNSLKEVFRNDLKDALKKLSKDA